MSEEDKGGYVLEKLTLDLNGIEPVPAYFAKPKGDGKRPTILYHHAHGGNYALGKEELLTGRPALQQPPYAEALTGMGYNVLCADTWLLGLEQPSVHTTLDKQVHRALLVTGMCLLETVANMHEITADRVYLAALPMKLGGLDGAPTRVVAIEGIEVSE